MNRAPVKAEKAFTPEECYECEDKGTIRYVRSNGAGDPIYMDRECSCVDNPHSLYGITAYGVWDD